MAYRAEADAAITAEALLPDCTGWDCDEVRNGTDDGWLVTAAHRGGFSFTFNVLDSEGIDWDSRQQVCLHDMVTEIRLRRGA